MAKTIDLTGGFDYTSDEADVASAVAFDFNTATAFSTSGAKLASFKNNSVEKTYMDKDGCIVGPAGSTSNATFSVGGGEPDTGIYGAAGAIRFACGGTQALSINSVGNLLLREDAELLVGGTTVHPGNPTNYVSIANGTEPSGALANTIAIKSKDSSDGSANATLSMWTEQAVEAIGTFTPSHKHKIWINGVEYWIQLDAV